MTLEQFRDQFSGGPWSLTDFADEAATVTDCEELSSAAKAFLDAEKAFYNALDKAGVEQG
jgi:ribosome maturation factor RimP